MHKLEISRVTRTKQQSRQVYDRLSRWYDFFAGGSEREFMDFGIQQLDPKAGENILELGCGTGHGLISLSQSVLPLGRIIGLDISFGMLTQARKHLQKSSAISSVNLQLGDASHLPYVAKIFSAVFLCFTLELFDTPEIPLVLAECKRILKSDGRMGIVCLEKQDCLSVRIYELAHKLLPSLVDCRPINVQQNLAQAGFDVTAMISKRMWGLPVKIVTAKENRRF